MTCYDPQGNNLAVKAPPKWYPCNYTTSDGFVACCQPDLGPCLPNLACGFTDQPETIIRGGCTDSTFKSPNCPQFLLDADPNRPDNLIHNCGNGTGCFNESAANSQDDCSCAPGSPSLLLIFSNSIVSATMTKSASSTSSHITTKSTSSSSSTTSAISTSILTITTTSLSTSPSSLVISGTASPSATAVPQTHESNVGTQVGTTFGVIGGVILLAVLAFFLRRTFLAKPSYAVRKSIASEPGLLVETIHVQQVRQDSFGNRGESRYFEQYPA